jgi:hypothetical protein
MALPPSVQLDAQFWFRGHPNSELRACLESRCTTLALSHSTILIQDLQPYRPDGLYSLTITGTDGGKTVLNKRLKVHIVHATGGPPGCPAQGYIAPIVRIEVNGLTHVIKYRDEPPSVPLPSNGATPDYPLTPVPSAG